MTITAISVVLACGALAVALNSLFILDNSHRPVALPSLTTGQHEYFRPPDDQVWGLPGNSSFSYFRSPCPALNALANHGHIPRDGKGLTPAVLRDGIRKAYNFDKTLLDLVFLALPSTFTLADLGDPNFIDHDASLVHVDSYFQLEPFKVNETLVDELLSRAEYIGDQGGRVITKDAVARFRPRNSSSLHQQVVITKDVVARFRRHREIECARDNPAFAMSALARFVANGGASL
ncbi:Chloroperoxidase, partial [Phytophthora palmivora]